VNIGNPSEITMLELARAIRDLCGSRSEIVFEPLPVDDPRRRRPDIRVARALLGWELRVSLGGGPGQTIAWWRGVAEGREQLPAPPGIGAAVG
jgi:nucleoside-diphosphate-sugar epimerase